MNGSNLSVLVLDSPSRQVLPILKELHELGCKITTLCWSKMDNGFVSRYPTKREIISLKKGDSFISVLSEMIKQNHYDVVLPLSDYSMNIVTKNSELLAPYTKLPIPSREVFLRAYNKQKTMEICMDNGIPCPRTLREGENLDSFLEAVGFPIIAKPRMANGSRGLKIIKNREKIRDLINSGIVELDNYVIQEFIPQKGKQYNIHLFRDDQGSLSSNLVTEKARWYPVDGGASCLCRTQWNQLVADYSQKLLDAVEWRSYCEIEMIVDPRDSIPKVMEINGRASASIKIMDLAGMNVAKQMLQLAMGDSVTKYSKAKDDIRLRCLLTDVLWFIQSPDRFSRKPSWFSPIRTHDALFSVADPLPFFAYIIGKVPEYRNEMKQRERD